jgi:hypothetical protein
LDSEDTMETASYLYVKIIYNIVYDVLGGEGCGSR